MSYVAETATLAWDYTMADVESLAWKAVNGTKSFGQVTSLSDRHETAWHAIVVWLYESREHPRAHDLIRAGRDAIYAEQAQWRQMYQKQSGNTGRAFARYWSPIRSTSDGFSDHLADVLSLPVVLALLNASEYEAIVALAAYGSQPEAAKALGIRTGTLQVRIHRARAKINQAWFAPETPPRAIGHGSLKQAAPLPDFEDPECRQSRLACDPAT
ncbi:hypothetical protein GCM10009798_43360 [Nocardioides panacihumi]|uniref:RNA polymerase sigma factor 70 region 4 type 2 domain-containing protein n=1 Tax=Nocardioides panacihumi TaxID=400774 RepID=A0ABN2RZ08_9ACTN